MKPTPGQRYIVQAGDTLSGIALRAYGDIKYVDNIRKSNLFDYHSDDPDEIFLGTSLYIPTIPGLYELKTEITKKTLTGKSQNEMTLIVDNVEISSKSMRAIRTMDTLADGWSAITDWTPGEFPEFDKLIKPYQYLPASVYIGNELLINGLLYTTESQINNDGITQKLEGWSFTADLIDSTVKPSYERNNVTLFQILEDIVLMVGGISVVINAEDIDSPFDRVAATSSESVANFLNRIVLQRKAVLSSTESGNILITQVTKNLNSVGIIENNVLSLEGRFNGRRRFNTYRAIGQSPFGNKEGISKDNKVPRSRFMTFRVNESIAGDIQAIAEWRRNLQLIKTLTISIALAGWINPGGNIWRENTIVTVKSDVLHIPDGFDFLIRAVEFIETSEGQTVILSLIPPQAYSKGEIVDPWE